MCGGSKEKKKDKRKETVKEKKNKVSNADTDEFKSLEKSAAKLNYRYSLSEKFNSKASILTGELEVIKDNFDVEEKVEVHSDLEIQLSQFLREE